MYLKGQHHLLGLSSAANQATFPNPAYEKHDLVSTVSGVLLLCTKQDWLLTGNIWWPMLVIPCLKWGETNVIPDTQTHPDHHINVQSPMMEWSNWCYYKNNTSVSPERLICQYLLKMKQQYGHFVIECMNMNDEYVSDQKYSCSHTFLLAMVQNGLWSRPSNQVFLPPTGRSSPQCALMQVCGYDDGIRTTGRVWWPPVSLCCVRLGQHFEKTFLSLTKSLQCYKVVHLGFFLILTTVKMGVKVI